MLSLTVAYQCASYGSWTRKESSGDEEIKSCLTFVLFVTDDNLRVPIEPLAVHVVYYG